MTLIAKFFIAMIGLAAALVSFVAAAISYGPGESETPPPPETQTQYCVTDYVYVECAYG